MSTERTLSPIQVIVLLENYFLPIDSVSEKIPSASQSWKDALEFWIECDCIAGVWQDASDPVGFVRTSHCLHTPNGLTPKGRAWVAAILSTPEPKQVWMTLDGRVLDTR